MDSRGLYIVSAKDFTIFIEGEQLSNENKVLFKNYANKYLKYLVKFEKASSEVINIKESHLTGRANKEENFEVRKIMENLFPESIGNYFCINEKFNYYFEKEEIKPKILSDLTLNQIEKKIEKKVFVYPDFSKNNPLDIDDFDSEEMIIILVKDENKAKMYRWKKNDDLEETEVEEYSQKCIKNFFGKQFNNKSLEVNEELFQEESDEFLNYLS